VLSLKTLLEGKEKNLKDIAIKDKEIKDREARNRSFTLTYEVSLLKIFSHYFQIDQITCQINTFI
jgi:hypothetical protein